MQAGKAATTLPMHQLGARQLIFSLLNFGVDMNTRILTVTAITTVLLASSSAAFAQSSASGKPSVVPTQQIPSLSAEERQKLSSLSAATELTSRGQSTFSKYMEAFNRLIASRRPCIPIRCQDPF
jgi:hypothetical protein